MTDDGSRDEFAPDNEMSMDDMSIDGMPDVRTDETLRDVVAALSVLPAVSESDVQRIVARAAAEGREATVLPMRRGTRRWFATMPMAAAAGLLIVAGIGGYAARGAMGGDPSETTIAAAPAGVPATGATAATGTTAAGAPVSQVAGNSSDEAPIPTQFVLDAPRAARVSLVGSFNGWDAKAAPLVRDPATGLWSITTALAPGRHVYAFMVDGAVLTLDPRAPSTRDPELGTTGSVILVGAP